MKLSHRQLEACQRDPRGWLRAQESDRFVRRGYDGYTKLGIFRFHRDEDPDGARDHLRGLLERCGYLTNERRQSRALEKLDDYIDWIRTENVSVVEGRVNLEFPVNGDLLISGRVERVDVVTGGYRAVLLGDYRADWQQQLRMPLLQMAVAHHYWVPVEDVLVGVQKVDGSELEVVSFSKPERDQARADVLRLADQLRALGA